MAWTKPSGTITAKVDNEDLSASFRFDQFNIGGGETEKALRCDFTIASDDAEDETQGFRLSDGLSTEDEAALKVLLAKCRDYALGLAGYSESG